MAEPEGMQYDRKYVYTRAHSVAKGETSKVRLTYI